MRGKHVAVAGGRRLRRRSVTRTVRYTVELYPDHEEGGYAGIVPALPGWFTQGKGVGECLDRVREAIAGYLECLQAAGKPIPLEEGA